MNNIDKLAREVADMANECCHRSDGFEEYVEQSVFNMLKGYALVPLEPTDVMLLAPWNSPDVESGNLSLNIIRQTYKAMLKAAQGEGDET